LSDRRERTRRLVHFAFGFCALLVPLLGREGSIAVAAAACAYNLAIAPALGWDAAYRRKEEPRMSGLATYPLAVLLLLAIAPLPAAMAAWGVLAAADPAAAAVGSRLPRPRVPWNAAKSLVGTLAAALVGTVVAWLLLRYAGVESPVVPAVAAGVAGAFAESLPWPIDDNLPVAAAAGAALVVVG
jgi:dolichol kinase